MSSAQKFSNKLISMAGGSAPNLESLSLEAVLTATGIGCATFDAKGAFGEASKRFLEIIGLEKSSIRSLSDLGLDPKTSQTRLDKNFAEATDSPRWVRLSLQPIQSQQAGNGWLVTAQDIQVERHATSQMRQTEQRLQEVERISGIGSWNLDLKTQKVTWSDSLYEIYGYDSQSTEPSYEKFMAGLDESTRQYAERSIQHSIRTGEPVEQEFVFHRPDGKTRYLRVRAKLVKDAEGIPVRFTGAVQDLTQNKAMEAQAKQSELVSRQILDAIPDMVLVKGEKSRLIWANKAFRDYYGMTNEQLRGMIDAEFNEPDYTQQYVKDDAYVYNTGKILDIPQEPVTRYDGVVRMFNTVKSPIFDETGKVTMTVGVSRDISERLEAQKVMENQRVKMISSAKMSSLGEMAAGIAHEINNPLAIIIGKSYQLREAVQDGSVGIEKVPEVLSKIESTAARIAKIVRGLRSFSRSGENDPPQPVPMESVIEDTLELCRERFKAHAIEIKIGEVPKIQVECRASQISQIILNLLSNAHDAVQGKAGAWVSLDVEVSGDRLKIKVTDSGNGISPDVVKKMMEPFFTTKDVGRGTGLGLSISKGIAEDHCGSLHYDPSSPNTRFVLELPISQSKK